ncbi:TPA: MarC family protein [Candidatus Micrarchaeota archaeon]|nr:MarC family protein [Candidatus Micrarchaeota archaeon]
MDFLPAVFISFITIFVIMDPFASLPPFLAITKGRKDNEITDIANKAILIAGIIALIFAFGGLEILKVLSITLADFKVAGGIVLGLLGLENVLNFSLSNGKDKKEDLESTAVLIATPILTGPGLISSLIVLVQDNGILPVLASLGSALILSWIILRNAVTARKILGDKIIIIFSKIMGLMLIALGISYIKAGLTI